ncbi:hypothetical protein TRSC58_07514 [Trypanosoma rangeli SC58]|uniref:Uncharacterized protein n=1 Tax=Trypanosoma rangeli SC58 TaxID=429131 RepID=A0A061IRW8_TRYRA|nr:hypothetical protein TRSC58_07514 [Trypanosoma rangeli SC58]
MLLFSAFPLAPRAFSVRLSLRGTDFLCFFPLFFGFPACGVDPTAAAVPLGNPSRRRRRRRYAGVKAMGKSQVEESEVRGSS